VAAFHCEDAFVVWERSRNRTQRVRFVAVTHSCVESKLQALQFGIFLLFILIFVMTRHDVRSINAHILHKAGR